MLTLRNVKKKCSFCFLFTAWTTSDSASDLKENNCQTPLNFEKSD